MAANVFWTLIVLAILIGMATGVTIAWGPEALLLMGFLVFLFAMGLVVMIIRCWRKVEQGTALIITGAKEPTVHFSKAIVLPLIRRAEIMDISVKRIEIFRHGSEGLVCRDNVRADIKVAFYVRVNNTTSDVLTVAQTVGAARASEQPKLLELFDAKFSEALVRRQILRGVENGR